MPNLRLAKIAGLMMLVLLVGSNLVLPAGAHVTKRIGHLFSHLDPRYVNASEKAADADLLDGQDSSAFLGASAKAADANLLDGQDSTAFLGASATAADSHFLNGLHSTAFMAGPGKVLKRATAMSPLNGLFRSVIETEDNFFRIGYECPSPTSANGVIRFINDTTGTINVFIENGSGNPGYHEVASLDHRLVPAAATGEYVLFQVHSPSRGIATIQVMTVNRASDCHAQAQAVISS
jgi:hypothetical protein